VQHADLTAIRTPPAPADRLDRQGLSWTRAAHVALIGMFGIMVGAVLLYAQPILLPVVSAVVVGTMFGPLQRRAIGLGAPPWLFALMVVLLLIGLLQLATVLLSGPVIDWVKQAPQMGEALKAKLEWLDAGMAAFRRIQNMVSPGAGDAAFHIDFAAVAQSGLAFVTPAMGELLIFIATLFFYLFSRGDLRRNLVLAFPDQDSRLRVIRILNEVEEDLTRYIGTVTLINCGVGVVTAGGAWLLGLPDAPLHGALAFACNFLPYVGPALVVLVLFGIGLIHYSFFGQAFIPPLLFVGLSAVEGHVVTPSIIGRSLTLNPFAVFLGLTFWTWLWGPVGAFLSVPFLIVGMVTIDHLDTRHEAELPG
jgi:predicted PurR-regulated permease PerM